MGEAYRFLCGLTVAPNTAPVVQVAHRDTTEISGLPADSATIQKYYNPRHADQRMLAVGSSSFLWFVRVYVFRCTILKRASWDSTPIVRLRTPFTGFQAYLTGVTAKSARPAVDVDIIDKLWLKSKDGEV